MRDVTEKNLSQRSRGKDRRIVKKLLNRFPDIIKKSHEDDASKYVLSPFELGLQAITVPRDGNCLWYALTVARALAGDENVLGTADKDWITPNSKIVNDLRSEVAQFIENNLDDNDIRRQLRARMMEEGVISESRIDTGEISFDDLDRDTPFYHDYLTKLKNGKIWSGELEVDCAARFLLRCIVLMEQFHEGGPWSVRIFRHMYENIGAPLMILRTDRNHYTPLDLTVTEVSPKPKPSTTWTDKESPSVTQTNPTTMIVHKTNPQNTTKTSPTKTSDGSSSSSTNSSSPSTPDEQTPRISTESEKTAQTPKSPPSSTTLVPSDRKTLSVPQTGLVPSKLTVDAPEQLTGIIQKATPKTASNPASGSSSSPSSSSSSTSKTKIQTSTTKGGPAVSESMNQLQPPRASPKNKQNPPEVSRPSQPPPTSHSSFKKSAKSPGFASPVTEAPPFAEPPKLNLEELERLALDKDKLDSARKAAADVFRCYRLRRFSDRQSSAEPSLTSASTPALVILLLIILTFEKKNSFADLVRHLNGQSGPTLEILKKSFETSSQEKPAIYQASIDTMKDVKAIISHLKEVKPSGQESNLAELESKLLKDELLQPFANALYGFRDLVTSDKCTNTATLDNIVRKAS
jgi:hypothetical protein